MQVMFRIIFRFCSDDHKQSGAEHAQDHEDDKVQPASGAAGPVPSL